MPGHDSSFVMRNFFVPGYLAKVRQAMPYGAFVSGDGAERPRLPGDADKPSAKAFRSGLAGTNPENKSTSDLAIRKQSILDLST